MKKKTYIKQSAYQKVDNTKGNNIKGALDLNKEVLDTLVDKTVLGTVNCCQYYPVIPVIDVQDASSPSDEDMSDIPCNGLFISRADTVMYIWVKDCLLGSSIELGNNL